MSRYVKLKLPFKEKIVLLFTSLVNEEAIISAYKDLNLYEPNLNKRPLPSDPYNSEEVKLEVPSLFNRQNKKKIMKTNLR